MDCLHTQRLVHGGGVHSIAHLEELWSIVSVPNGARIYMTNESTKVQNPRRNSYAVNRAMELCTYIIYTSVVYILRMRVRVLAAPSRPSPVSRLFHASS